MILLSKDETATRRAWSTALGVATAMSDEPVDPHIFLGGVDTIEEARTAASPSNLQRAMSRALSRRDQ